MDSKITIIVSVYNAEAFLKESLNSIIRQIVLLDRLTMSGLVC